MDYTTYTTLPAYEQANFKNGDVVDRDGVRWSGKEPPPPIGTEIVVTMWTTPGVGVVTGYFSEAGWLGLLVRMYTAPEWFRKRNPHNMTAHIFGPEYRLAVTEGTPNDVDLAALTSYAAEFGRTWKSFLREDWMKARTINGPGWADRGRILHCLRNNPDFGPRGLEKFRLNERRNTHV
jgi:hypothetical protein